MVDGFGSDDDFALTEGSDRRGGPRPAPVRPPVGATPPMPPRVPPRPVTPPQASSPTPPPPSSAPQTPPQAVTPPPPTTTTPSVPTPSAQEVWKPEVDQTPAASPRHEVYATTDQEAAAILSSWKPEDVPAAPARDYARDRQRNNELFRSDGIDISKPYSLTDGVGSVEDEDEDAEPQGFLGGLGASVKSKWAAGGKGDPKKGAAKGGAKTDPKKGGTKTTKGKMSDFQGSRGRVLAIQIAVIIVFAVIVLNGLARIINPSSGPTAEQVKAVALQAIGETGFPLPDAEAFSLSFTKTFLSFDRNFQEQRETDLLHFGPQSFINAIDVEIDGSATQEDGQRLTTEEIAQQSAMVVTDGPYVARRQAIDATHAVITTRAQINGRSWVYLAIPITHDPVNGTLVIGGNVSLVPPPGVGDIVPTDYAASWNNDTATASLIEADIENYMRAWGASDGVSISRYIATDASLAARAGLSGSVNFVSMTAMSVQPAETVDVGETAETGATATKRLIEFDVTWNVPNTLASYKQTYRAVIVDEGGRWYVADIRNPMELPEDGTGVDHRIEPTAIPTEAPTAAPTPEAEE